MGCDIHVYIEYWNPRWFQNNPFASVNSFGREGIYISRNYALFAHLAGVRDYSGYYGGPLFPPRGIPEQPALSWEIREQYFVSVRETDDADDNEHCCSLANAEDWVRHGSSYWAHERHEWAKLQLERGYRYVSGPDWHTASWLTLAEAEQVLAQYRSRREPFMQHAVMDEPRYPSGWIDPDMPDGRPHYWRKLETDQEIGYWRGRYLITVGDPEPLEPMIDFEACLAAMRAFEAGGYGTRLVFWFDN